MYIIVYYLTAGVFLETFASLKAPIFRKWILGQSIAVFGNWIQITAQGFLIFDLTHSPFFLGATAFAGGISAWFCTLHAGVIADRISRRYILLCTYFMSMLLAIIMALLTFTKLVQPWHILVISFLFGISNAFEAPAKHAFVKDIVDIKHIGNAISLNSSVFNLGTSLGPALSGITYLTLGPSWCFTINALSFLPLIFILFTMRINLSTSNDNQKFSFRGIREGVGYSFKHEIVRPILAVVVIVSTFGFSLFTLLPAWAVSVLHGNAGTNGLLQSARGIGALTGAITMASFNSEFRKGRILCIASVVFPFLLIGFAFSENLISSLLLISLVGICFVFVYNAANTLLQYIIHDEIRGRVMSLYMLAFLGTTPIGSFISGYFSQIFGERNAILVYSIIAFFFVIPIIFLSPQLREH